MNTPSSSIRQGRDWSTSRASVAELLNTIDMMHDFCVLQDTDEDLISAENGLPIHPTLTILCNHMTSEASLAYPDTIPTTQHSFDLTQGWTHFEMQHYLREIVQKISNISEETTIQKISSIIPLLKHVKLILRQLDQ